MPAFAQIPLLIKALRPKQWAKNMIVYAPVLFAGQIHDGQALIAATEAVVALSFVSGGSYILNDVLDVEQDRQHPTKRNRPIASGQLDSKLAITFASVVIFLGLLLSYIVRPTLALIVLTYLVLTVSYALYLKHYPLIDVFCIAGGFVLRAVAGAVAVKVPVSGWFLLVTSFGSLFLALEKRRQELKSLGDNAELHRKALTGYSEDLLDRIEALIVPSLLTSYAFYSFQSIHGQWMMLTVPFVLYGVMRYQWLSVQHNITGAPEDVLWKDKPIQVTIILWLLVAAAVIYGQLPRWFAHVAQFMDALQLFPRIHI